jgi:hypothetical protein
MMFQNVFILRVASEPVKAVIERHMATHLAASLSTVIGAAIVGLLHGYYNLENLRMRGVPPTSYFPPRLGVRRLMVYIPVFSSATERTDVT